MAGYTITALAQDQNGPTSQFVVAVLVTATNGMGVQNLSESNFTVRKITAGSSHISIAGLRNADLPGFYLLSLRAEPEIKAGEHILALVATIRQHPVGRIPEDVGVGQAMVKVKIV